MIWFWCDSRASIGLGHVVRCLALAQWAERRGTPCRFVVPELWPGLRRFVAHFHFDFEVADGPPAAGAGDVLVIDGYDFALDQVRSDATTVLIDDLGERDPVVDVVLNPNVYAPTLRYPSAGRALLGSDYTLLRPEFVEARATADAVRARVERVFVMLGGVDPTNETGRVLSALRRAGFAGRVDLVTARDDLDAASTSFELVVHRAIPSPAPLMQEADIAICAAGGSTWELACVGLPAIQIVVADNQRKIGEWLRAHDAAVVLDSPIDEETLAAHVDALGEPHVRAAFRATARSLIDGRGAERVLDVIVA